MLKKNQTIYVMRVAAGIALMLVGILCFVCTILVMGALGKTWYAGPLILLGFGAGLVVSVIGAALHPELI